MVAVFDSCHSGTVLDLPWIYRSNGHYKTPGISKEKIGQEIIEAGMHLISGDSAGALKSVGATIWNGIKAKRMAEANKKKTIISRKCYYDCWL